MPETLQHRAGEPAVLRACLGAAINIMTAEHGGIRLNLNRRRVV